VAGFVTLDRVGRKSVLIDTASLRDGPGALDGCIVTWSFQSVVAVGPEDTREPGM
jgi:hypothetical protein